MKYSLNDYVHKTQEIISKFPRNEKWTIHNRFAELIEESGELANAIQTEEGFKSKKRKKSDLIDSVCDVLFEILAIASHYKINLDTEYPKVLKQIKDRQKNGEFDHE